MRGVHGLGEEAKRINGAAAGTVPPHSDAAAKHDTTKATPRMQSGAGVAGELPPIAARRAGSSERSAEALLARLKSELFPWASRHRAMKDAGVYSQKLTRINQPYPSAELSARSIEQSLPIEVTTPFKYLRYDPLYMDAERRLLLLVPQIEGGEDWLGGGIECRDAFILLERDSRTGKYVQRQSLQLAPFDGQQVFRLTKVERLDERRVRVEVETGSYQWITQKSLVYRVGTDGIGPLPAAP